MKSSPRNAIVVAAAVLLGIPLALPGWLLGGGGVGGSSAAFRYPIEYGLVVLAIAAMASFRSFPGLRVVRAAMTALYAFMVLFLVYESAVLSNFHREPALIEDVRLAINLAHFLSEMRTAPWILAGIAGLTAYLAVIAAFAWTMRGIIERASAIPPKRWLMALAAYAMVAASLLSLHGPVQLVGEKLVANARASLAIHRRLAQLDGSERDDRYREYAKIKMARRPNIYFLVIEAYGEVLTTWDMTTAYRDLMDRVEKRLSTAGFSGRTVYSLAPVHGGSSWLSLATLQSGILIDQPESFARFQARSREIPTLVGFLHDAGYHTASLEPLTKDRVGVKNEDLYPHDVRVGANALAYEGPRYGFGVIPDRYSLTKFRKDALSALGEPRYVFYMAVSTHYPWTAETVPTFEGGPAWPPLAGEGEIGSDLRRYYVKSVDYEWRSLLEFIEADPSQDLVVVVLGDHQPRLESNAPGEVSFHTPIHVLSRDRAFVDSFADLGFQRGLFATPGVTAALNHEALFSILVSKLAAFYATPETKEFAHVFREGASLRALNP